MSVCPCGSGNTYDHCCGRFISLAHKPSTPEELMRSRYTAFTRADIDYIARTMKAPASNHFDVQEAGAWARQVKWLELEVIRTESKESKGLVEFRAHYSYQGKRECLHEISVFCLEQGQWYYCDGQKHGSETAIPKGPKISRNDSCPCGSGKKYKKCCLIIS